MERLHKKGLISNPIGKAKTVAFSEDGKAALVLAGFNEDRLDYREIQREITRIRAEIEDDNTKVYVAGEPALKGWVWFFTNELFLIFTWLIKNN